MKLIRKLILGCITTGLVATTLAATTYAWYKLGNAAFAKDFEFNASTTEGFVVSVDGINFKQKLSTEDIVKAMIVGKRPTNYMFDSDGNVLDIKNDYYKLNSDEINVIYKNVISLEPVTSKDGSSIRNLSNSIVNEYGESSSKYAYFELYFKTIGASAEENYTYNIYLDGLGYDDGRVSAGATSVWSAKATNVDLIANMTTYSKEYLKGDKIQVYTSNASRFSVQDLGYVHKNLYRIIDTSKEVFDENEVYYIKSGLGTYSSPNNYEPIEISEFGDDNYYVISKDASSINMYDTTQPNGNSNIYELSENQDYDLGSFATDYSGDDEGYNRLYNCNYNAMFTYYNNIKTKDKLKSPHFDTDLPQTIRSLTTYDENGVKINTKDIIATVKSGEVTKVALRFWIEGWDGDCFDGLPGYFTDSYGLVTGEFDTNQTYYTRTGSGTDEDPYIYTKAVITSFAPNTDYYEVTSREEKEVNPINCRLLFNSIKVD